MEFSPKPDDVTKFAQGLDAFQQRIGEELNVYCDRRVARSNYMHPGYGSFWESIRDVVAAGGKRLRPYLTVQAFEGFGGDPQQQPAIYDVAMAWELLHIGMLMHDDIIDRDTTRHGKLNVAGQMTQVYRKAGVPEEAVPHQATSSALLAGDVLIADACRLVGSTVCTAFPDQSQHALDVLDEAVFCVVGGELLDTESAFKKIADVDTEQIADLKTASYSIVGPLLTGALLAGAPEASLARLRAFGVAMGIGYQLHDDILGVFGQEAATGKSTTSDLTEGKRTMLMQKAYAMASSTQKEQIDALLGQQNIEAATVLRALLDQLGVRKVVEEQAEAYMRQALDSLKDIPMQQDAKQNLQMLVGFALQRDK